jgi:6-phosphogluconolactonase
MYPKWILCPSAAAVAATAATRIAAAARRALARDGELRLALAGGRTPLEAYRLLMEEPTDWERWRVLFGDERCLPPEDPERNSRAAWEAWLGRVPIPPQRVAVIPAEQGPEAAAAAYAPLVRAALPFHLVLLGLGEDGHTASLFPGQPEPPAALVLPVHRAPKPPPQRVSLSSAALSAAEEVLILVTGRAKRQAVARWRAGEDLPVARIRALGRLEVLLDPEAAGTGPGA